MWLLPSAIGSEKPRLAALWAEVQAMPLYEAIDSAVQVAAVDRSLTVF